MPTSAKEFLDAAYDQLQYKTGVGFRVPTNSTKALSVKDAIETFEWLSLAATLEADRVFFIDNYPVALFFEFENIDEEQIRQLHIKVWNMCRAPYFFVALPGELRAYNAYDEPVKNEQEWGTKNRWLARVTEVARIAEELKKYSRPEFEAARAFADFEKKRKQRADQLLLKNLTELRRELQKVKPKLTLEQSLNLIGRSIFIRYLEARKVLVDDYFQEIGRKDSTTYFAVLRSKKDTYRLFKKLRTDFNGNMFPLTNEEEENVTSEHLNLLCDFLQGKNLGDQPSLFFWAYDFEIIPVELISSIYEEFYHELEEEDTQDTHYTPETLVDFVLSQALTDKQLESGTVMDLSCGSGIFLVEAFRRMVYFQMGKHKRRLKPKQLETILSERIFGIDVNAAAVSVAAFSLYLTLLDFMEPSDIRQHKLPLLVHDSSQENGNGNLFVANSFWLTRAEREKVLAGEKSSLYSTRQLLSYAALPLGDKTFDLVVGNPPWGAAKEEVGKTAIHWKDTFGYPVGDNELSQCFVWRSKTLLAPNGIAALLISSSAFFKHLQPSIDFRHALLEQTCLRAVYNFAHVRHVFFRGQKNEARSPFVALLFTPTDNKEQALSNRFVYTAVKRNRMVEGLQAVAYDKSDRHVLPQWQFIERETLWKTLLWGNNNDVQILADIEQGELLDNLVSEAGQGFKEESHGENRYFTSELGVGVELPDLPLSRRQISSSDLVLIKPRKLGQLGHLNLYHGSRLLIGRGIKKKGLSQVSIISTLTSIPFAFNSTIHAVSFDGLSIEKQKVILGIFWSSLLLYYQFLTCSMWGFWHFEIHLHEHLRLPIRFPQNKSLEKRIVNLVDILSDDSMESPLSRRGKKTQQELEAELDKAIFDLYELSPVQIDLIQDFKNITLDFFYKGMKSDSVKSPSPEEMQVYVDAFLEVWQERLTPKRKALEPQIYIPQGAPMIGVSFDLKQLGKVRTIPPFTEASDWNTWLTRLDDAVLQPVSERVYLESVVKILAGGSMFLAKRAERRLWTRSQARQDAHELLTEVFKAEWQRGAR